jgi:hypothetical protein
MDSAIDVRVHFSREVEVEILPFFLHAVNIMIHMAINPMPTFLFHNSIG